MKTVTLVPVLIISIGAASVNTLAHLPQQSITAGAKSSQTKRTTMKLIRLTGLDDIDIIVNTAHIECVEISDDGWSRILLTTKNWIFVKQSFNEIIKLSRGEA